MLAGVDPIVVVLLAALEVAGAELIDVAPVVVLVVFLTLIALAVMRSLRDR